jgi:Na+/melibiose symporter-like transporter
MKRLGGDPIKTTQLSLLGGVVSGVLIFLLNAVGILSKMPVLFFFGLFISLFFTSLNFVPSNVVWLECGDYNIYKTRKEMNGMVNAANKFLQKAQTALASGVVGLILIAIGYQVDSVTDTFTGSLDAIPEMLNWFIVVLGLLPATVALISFLIYKYAYPITPQVRLEMNAELQRRRDLSKVKS